MSYVFGIIFKGNERGLFQCVNCINRIITFLVIDDIPRCRMLTRNNVLTKLLGFFHYMKK